MITSLEGYLRELDQVPPAEFGSEDNFIPRIGQDLPSLSSDEFQAFERKKQQRYLRHWSVGRVEARFFCSPHEDRHLSDKERHDKESAERKEAKRREAFDLERQRRETIPGTKFVDALGTTWRRRLNRFHRTEHLYYKEDFEDYTELVQQQASALEHLLREMFIEAGRPIRGHVLDGLARRIAHHAKSDQGAVEVVERAEATNQHTLGSIINWIYGLAWALREPNSAPEALNWVSDRFTSPARRRPDEQIDVPALLMKAGFPRFLGKLAHKYRNPAVHHRVVLTRGDYEQWCTKCYCAPSLAWWLEIGTIRARTNADSPGNLGVFSLLASSWKSVDKPLDVANAP